MMNVTLERALQDAKWLADSAYELGDLYRELGYDPFDVIHSHLIENGTVKSQNESQRQCTLAWFEVMKALDQVFPDWMDCHPGTGSEAAVTAIHLLALGKVPDESECAFEDAYFGDPVIGNHGENLREQEPIIPTVAALEEYVVNPYDHSDVIKSGIFGMKAVATPAEVTLPDLPAATHIDGEVVGRDGAGWEIYANGFHGYTDQQMLDYGEACVHAAQCQVRKDGGTSSPLTLLEEMALHGESFKGDDASRLRAITRKLTKRDLPHADRALLRKLVDKAWQEATESEQVPSTQWADEIINSVIKG